MVVPPLPQPCSLPKAAVVVWPPAAADLKPPEPLPLAVAAHARASGIATPSAAHPPVPAFADSGNAPTSVGSNEAAASGRMRVTHRAAHSVPGAVRHNACGGRCVIS